MKLAWVPAFAGMTDSGALPYRIVRDTILILFLYAIASTTAVFAANASRVDNNKAHMVPIESRNQPLIDGGNETSSASSGKSDASYTALGYYMSPGVVLGTTSCDLQHNMRMARQVAVGADGRTHFVWTRTAVPYDAGDRRVMYTTYYNGILDEAMNTSDWEPAKTPGRYATVDVFQNRGLVVDHYGSGPATTSALDIGSASYSFAKEDPPSTVVNREGILTNGATTLTNNYIWPVVAADVDPIGNKLVIHIAAMEGNTASGSWKAITYFRGVSSGVIMEVGMYGTAGMFVDSCQAIGYDIAASPYNDDVVIAYPIAREANRENNDLAYRLSTNLGETWGPRVNVTNYPSLFEERVKGDLSVLFTVDGYFHILYVTNIYDSAAGTMSDPEAKLWHWSSQFPTKRSLVVDANNADPDCNTPAFEYAVCKPALTQCFSTTLNDTLLYAVYSFQPGSTLVPDCSDWGYYNQDVVFQASSTWGETWGAPVNVTNTNSNGCVAPNCADDGSASSARYVTDTLRIQYLEDLDAGSSVANDGGTSTLNPVKFISYPCIAMADYRIMTCTPSAIGYPFHAKPDSTATQDLFLVNGGNLSITWNASVSGSIPISMALTGNIPAGYTNSATITATFGPIAYEGLYRGTITFSYDSPVKTIEIPVELYTFDRWFLPENVAIRTSTNRMMANQAGQAANNIQGSSFSYFADLNQDFIKDASLILGNSADNLSWLIFNSSQSDPTPSNNFGRLYALSNTKVDSTTYPPTGGYTIACGGGTNRDSTVGFNVQWYAPHHVDSADFYIGHFDIYKGTKDPTGTVSNLTIAFSVDWDVPAHVGTSSDNIASTDPTNQMIYFQADDTIPAAPDYTNGYAAVAAYRNDAVPITGGFAWGNAEQVYPRGGFHVDSVWKYMELTSVTPYEKYKLDSATDQSVVLVIAKDYAVTPVDTFKFNVVLTANRAQNNDGGGLSALNLAVTKAKAFITSWNPRTELCPSCESCGEANSDGTIDISDAVFLIGYIFSGGAAPGDCIYPKGKGDANGDGTVDISDAVYLISYIFSGGAAPHCCQDITDCPTNIHQGNTDVTMRVDGALPTPGTPQMFVGRDHRLEIWFTNSAKLKGFSLGLEFSSSRTFTLVQPYGNVPEGAEIIQEHGTVNNNFLNTFGGLNASWTPNPPNGGLLFFGGADVSGLQTKNLFAHLTSTFGYSIKVRIPADQPAGTFCVRPVSVPPAGSWLMDAGLNIDLITGLPSGATNPDFQGVPTVSSLDPGIPFPGPACFAIAGDGLALTFSQAFDVCPAGDAPFRVTIKNGLGNPIVGDTAIRVTLENCGGVRTCSSPSLPSTLYPIGPSDANGQVSFYTSGLNCGSSCRAVIRRKTEVYGNIPVRSFDTNGDEVVSITGDWSATSMCNDFNGNNTIDFNDQNLFTQHLGHRCATTPDPCDLFGSHFLLNPNTNLDSGTVVNISLSIANNNQSQVCNVGMIDFYESPFGTGGTETFLYSMPYNHTFQPGEQDTTPTFQYKIPSWGARCLKARFTPSCCSRSQIEAQECFDARRPCLPDGRYCYHFKISLTTPMRQCWRMEYLDYPAWELTDLRPGGFPYSGTTGSDSIDYMICTPNNPQLGDTGSVTIYVEDYSSRVWTFVNQVVVTSNTGDANGDCIVDISDAVYLIGYIFSGGTAPVPYEAGDVNCDDVVDISDAVYLIAYIFSGGIPPCLVTPDLFILDYGE